MRAYSLKKVPVLIAIILLAGITAVGAAPAPPRPPARAAAAAPAPVRPPARPRSNIVVRVVKGIANRLGLRQRGNRRPPAPGSNSAAAAAVGNPPRSQPSLRRLDSRGRVPRASSRSRLDRPGSTHGSRRNLRRRSSQNVHRGGPQTASNQYEAIDSAFGPPSNATRPQVFHYGSTSLAVPSNAGPTAASSGAFDPLSRPLPPTPTAAPRPPAPGSTTTTTAQPSTSPNLPPWGGVGTRPPPFGGVPPGWGPPVASTTPSPNPAGRPLPTPPGGNRGRQ